MLKSATDQPPRDQWTLIRGARQLLTLHGPSGPRRGSAMNELSVIADGALLIHNGMVEESGPARRVENLAQSRNARIIEAAGRIVMPAFVDCDTVLVFPPPSLRRGDGEGTKTAGIHVLSRRRLETVAAAVAAEFTRYGILSVGAHTAHATTLRDAVKILRIHHGLQSKPLRIRSIFSPPGVPSDLIAKWLPAIRSRRLAQMLELSIAGDAGVAEVREAATAAAGLGYTIRFRAGASPEGDFRRLAAEAGGVALIASPGPPADPSCVHVVTSQQIFDSGDSPVRSFSVRALLDDGAAVALGSGYRPGSNTSFNPQYLLQLAVERMGFTQEEAIVALTYNAASSLRMSHATGSLEPGKNADLVIMDVGSYRDLFRRAGHTDVHLAMRAGNVVYRRAGLKAD